MKKMTTKQLVQIAMLASLATVLMIVQVPVPFAPSFYQLDLSEVPVLIGTFAMGPLSGVLIELIKILLNFIIDGTTTAGIGELANFIIGCAFCIPAGMVYHKRKNKKAATIGLLVGGMIMTIIAALLNAFLLLPIYATAFNMPIDSLVQMGTLINPNINGMFSFILLAVVPFNILKGAIISVVVLVSYKKISVVLRG